MTNLPVRPIEVVEDDVQKVMVGVIITMPTMPTKDGYGLPFVAHDYINYN